MNTNTQLPVCVSTLTNIPLRNLNGDCRTYITTILQPIKLSIYIFLINMLINVIKVNFFMDLKFFNGVPGYVLCQYVLFKF